MPMRSLFPDEVNWADKGCDLHHSCLTCPFSACRYDFANGFNTFKAEERRKKVLELRAAGRSREEIAAVTGITIRQVSRIAAGAARA